MASNAWVRRLRMISPIMRTVIRRRIQLEAQMNTPMAKMAPLIKARELAVIWLSNSSTPRETITGEAAPAAASSRSKTITAVSWRP